MVIYPPMSQGFVTVCNLLWMVMNITPPKRVSCYVSQDFVGCVVSSVMLSSVMVVIPFSCGFLALVGRHHFMTTN